MPVKPIRFSFIILIITAFLLPSLAPMEALASTHHHKKNHHHHHYSSRVSPLHFSELAVDGDNGRVIYSKNASTVSYPASLTKMMTLYLTFDALKKGKLKLDQTLIVSSKAARQPQTNIALEKGDRLPVRIAIESIVVRSANDSAMTLGEALGKTEWNFALMMTKKARELGMKNTVFRNPSGLPDRGQHTTAFDMARLAIALRRDFPEYYHFFSMQSFDYDGVTYPGHNHVMERYPDMVDGVKTGYIRASGYNLVTSAHRDGHSVVAVIMGGRTSESRDDQMVSLLDHTFDHWSAHKRLADDENVSPDEVNEAEDTRDDNQPIQTAQGN